MTGIFERYAYFYDVYYREKDYAAECEYVLKLLGRYCTFPVKTILDLGCGTGTHDLYWTRAGLSVTGLDLSTTMLDQARKKSSDEGLKIEFINGDIRSIALNRTFDAATSMFAVLGYLTDNDDLERAFDSVRRHLNSGGLFIFDAWHGAAVLSQSPQSREKKYRGSEPDHEIVRSVRPELDVFRHQVRTHITVRQYRKSELIEEIQECHSVRYFFPQELAYYLSKTGFEVISITPFMQFEGVPGITDWNTTVVARAGKGGRGT